MGTAVWLGKGAHHQDGPRFGQRVAKQRFHERGALGEIDVDDDCVGRVRSDKLERRLRVVGSFALERRRSGRGLVGEGVGQFVATDDENGKRHVSPLTVFLGLGEGDALTPSQRRQIAERLGNRYRLLLAKGAGLRAPIQHGERLLQSGRHRVQTKKASSRSERMQASTQFLARFFRSRIGFERSKELLRVADFARQRRKEARPGAAELLPLGAADARRRARHVSFG